MNEQLKLIRQTLIDQFGNSEYHLAKINNVMPVISKALRDEWQAGMEAGGKAATTTMKMLMK